ncbi:hypothetical protein F1559_002372 [Cyanidiococcus yangmingshanensis]|uniref:Uncharacterized protein n=1 Tax=Cyanidiococcus yangmingshanensis TaxID=2690220 RepID=A0A7J7IF42_9RHOD|nr:hypothetical protein F1559_002372 [Cyanidiococcus yangmingshanensis]
MFVFTISSGVSSPSRALSKVNLGAAPKARFTYLRVSRAQRSPRQCRMQQQPQGREMEPFESSTEAFGSEAGQAYGENGLPDAFQVDMPAPTRSRRTGATIDADGKGNVWAIEPRVYTETSGESTTKRYLALAVAGFIGLAILVLRYLPLTNADQM